jgi:hypothetical protein
MQTEPAKHHDHKKLGNFFEKIKPKHLTHKNRPTEPQESFHQPSLPAHVPDQPTIVTRDESDVVPASLYVAQHPELRMTSPTSTFVSESSLSEPSANFVPELSYAEPRTFMSSQPAEFARFAPNVTAEPMVMQSEPAYSRSYPETEELYPASTRSEDTELLRAAEEANRRYDEQSYQTPSSLDFQGSRYPTDRGPVERKKVRR